MSSVDVRQLHRHQVGNSLPTVFVQFENVRRKRIDDAGLERFVAAHTPACAQFKHPKNLLVGRVETLLRRQLQSSELRLHLSLKRSMRDEEGGVTALPCE